MVLCDSIYSLEKSPSRDSYGIVPPDNLKKQ